MGHELAMILMLLGLATPASAHLGNNVEYASVRIGIRLNFFPTLIVIPGYPVYYAPQLDTNFFFYDGMYWVYQDDYWYASSWYDGPWILVDPEVVPLFILRIPVRYYRRPPVYFYGWHRDSPPHWGEHWGHRWEQHRSGWDKWDRRSAPPLAPLPLYQRQYSGNRYPQLQQQQELQRQNYRYQPHDDIVRQHYQRQERAIPPTQGPGIAPSSQPGSPVQQPPQPAVTPQREQQTRQPQQQPRESRPQPVQTMPQTREMQRNAPVQQERPTPLPQSQKRDEGARAPTQLQQTGPSAPRPQQQPRPEEFQREQRQSKPPSAQKSSPQDRGSSQESKQDQQRDQDKDRVQTH